MRFHIRTCEAYLQQGGQAERRGSAHLRQAGLDAAPPGDEEDSENDDEDIKHKFLHATDEELKGMGFTEPRARTSKRCHELWANFQVNNETGEAICMSCKNTFAMVSF